MIKPTLLFDTNNYARVKLETDPMALRALFEEAYWSQNHCVYFFDGFKSKSKRLERYPEYKGKRKPAPDNFYLMLNIFKELLMHTKSVLVEVPYYEADDVIATFCGQNPTTPIIIHSTDRDFCALLRDGLTSPMAKTKGIDPCDVRLHKTLLGDTSDNIPGFKGYGPKAWEKLTKDQKRNWAYWLEGGMEEVDLGPMTVTQQNWFEVIENKATLRMFWEIIGFYHVPPEDILKGIKVGTPDYSLANKKLKELFQ